MGKPRSRRNFLRSFIDNTLPATSVDYEDKTEDPLFVKYSRKKLGVRHYSTDEISYQTREQDASREEERVGNVTSGLVPYNGVLTKAEVLHLLRRTNFGFKKAFLDKLTGLTADEAVNLIVSVDSNAPAPPVNWYQNIFADESALDANVPDVGYGQDWTGGFFPVSGVGQTSNHYRMDSLRRWLFGLTLNGTENVREKMVWFWYHFLPIDFESIYESSNSYISTNCARLFYSYFKLLRSNATGNFKDLMFAISKEPAMIYYLNTQANSKNAPDENYARELMELFTLGKDPESQYTQADVIAAAKVLTGWRVELLNTVEYKVNLKSTLHTTGSKQFSSFFNNRVITYVPPVVLPGQTTIQQSQYNAAGDAELQSLIDMIFMKSEVVSKYICRRLYRYFVYYDIDSNVEANVITPLAQTFVANNWNIEPVLKQLFKSQHFFDLANRGVYIKSPFDLVAGSINIWKLDTGAADTEQQYRIWSRYNDTYSSGMEQRMGTIPNVSGWNAYYQTPAYHQYWINSNAVQKRFVFIRDHFSGFSIGGVAGRTFKVDSVAFVKEYFDNATITNPDLLVDACVQLLLPVDLSIAQKNALRDASVLYNQTGTKAADYWITAWTNYYNNPTNTSFQTLVAGRLNTLLSSICQLAEFQLM